MCIRGHYRRSSMVSKFLDQTLSKSNQLYREKKSRSIVQSTNYIAHVISLKWFCRLSVLQVSLQKWFGIPSWRNGSGRCWIIICPQRSAQGTRVIQGMQISTFASDLIVQSRIVQHKSVATAASRPCICISKYRSLQLEHNRNIDASNSKSRLGVRVRGPDQRGTWTSHAKTSVLKSFSP